MSNFCKHCGAKLENNPSVCPSCNKSLALKDEVLSAENLAAAKKNIMNVSERVLDKAKNVASDLVSETKKINEARKEAVQAVDIKNAENKAIAVKEGVSLFARKLSWKQWGLLVAVFALLFYFVSGDDVKTARVIKMDASEVDSRVSFFQARMYTVAALLEGKDRGNPNADSLLCVEYRMMYDAVEPISVQDLKAHPQGNAILGLRSHIKSRLSICN